MLTQEELISLKDRIYSYRNSLALPTEECLSALLKNAIDALNGEDGSYRPLGDSGKVGGLLDFKSNSEKLPAIIVPDIHARPDFLIRLLDFTLDSGQSVLNALNEDKLIVLCVGDCIHTEASEADYERWKSSFQFWQEGKIDCPPMREEMHLGISTMMVVMELKAAFPSRFHFLKGNHENILNAEGGGDFPFRKFAMEGQMVRDFIKEVYGDSILNAIHNFEYLLPIVAIFDNFCVSHAEPCVPIFRPAIVNYHDEAIQERVVLNFTWTGNGEARDGSVEEVFENLTKLDKSEAVWIGGHRPVINRKYFLRQDGHYVQIHNPLEMNIAYIRPGTKFNPETDIVPINGK